MSPGSAPLFLGIDAGGTSTRAAVGTADLKVLGAGRSVSAQVVRNGVETAVAVIREAALQALQGGYGDRVAGVCVGVAGAGPVEIRAHIQSRLQETLHPRVEVCTDYAVALFGALRNAPGVLVQVGTGAVGVAQDAALQVYRCGGWGWLLGDEGSGVWIGREAVRAVLWAADGRGPATRLTGLLEKRLGHADPASLVWHWRDAPDPARDMADLVPDVLAAQGGGDGVAVSILEEAGMHAARIATSLMQRVPAARTVCFGGGILTHSATVQTRFVQAVETATGCRPQPAPGDGTQGALWHAVRTFGHE